MGYTRVHACSHRYVCVQVCVQVCAHAGEGTFRNQSDPGLTDMDSLHSHLPRLELEAGYHAHLVLVWVQGMQAPVLLLTGKCFSGKPIPTVRQQNIPEL